MKFLIMAGHTLSENMGCGSVEYIGESNETQDVEPKVFQCLKALGEDGTYICLDRLKTDACLKEQVDLANSKGTFDYAIQIHFNCGCTDKYMDKSEIFYLSDKGKFFADRVNEKLSTIFKDRGIKQNSKYYWLKHTKSPAILIEVSFVDDKNDVKAYQENFEKVCKLIAEGLGNKGFEAFEKTVKYRIVTCGFTKDVAEENMKYLQGLTGWLLTIKEQHDGSYCIVTGGFDKDRAESKLLTLVDLTGWGAKIEEDI